MKIVCAYLLAALGGKSSPTVDDVKDILSSVGIEPDEDRLQLFFDQVSGKDLAELIAAGREKLASVPAGGGAVAVAAAPAGGAGGAAAEPAKEEKVEEKEESDDDMGFSLFD
ncbi:60S acidic ribosomal protein P2A-like [Amaranthus tricolor]|uniref:60S acidic ribosomal protein P2A-like n=1 Tax=Amaranthus tricolor TaxID=29722 RepID=UPI0025853431|nr:60S acidic ribosomal protein P2A-like [Amaranthus tricolor]